jgi:hypothetical protein
MRPEKAFEDAVAKGSVADAIVAAQKAADEAGPQPEDEFASSGITDKRERFLIIDNLEANTDYEFVVRSIGSDGAESAEVSAPKVAPKLQHFLGTRAWFAPFLLITCGSSSDASPSLGPGGRCTSGASLASTPSMRRSAAPRKWVGPSSTYPACRTWTRCRPSPA